MTAMLRACVCVCLVSAAFARTNTNTNTNANTNGSSASPGNVFSAMSYGAKGDNRTDDTAIWRGAGRRSSRLGSSSSTAG